MTPGFAYHNSLQQDVVHRKRKITCNSGSRLLSDVESAAAPSLQFCMPQEGERLAIVGRTGSLQRSHVKLPPANAFSSWDSYRGGLTGNVFVDYRRYRARQLGVQDLQVSREETAFRSLEPNAFRALASRHSAAITRLSLDHTRRYLLTSSRDCTIALYDLRADEYWDLNGGFGPNPKVYPVGYVQRRPDRPCRRILHPLRYQPAAQGAPLARRGARRDVYRSSTLYAHAASALQSGHRHSVTSVEFMPGDSGLFVSVGLDKLLKIWDTRAWECVLDIAVESPLLCCAFDRLASQRPALSPKSVFACGSLEHTTEAPAQLLLAAGCQDGSLRIFDLRCGTAQQTLLGHSGAVVAVAWDPCASRQLFSGSSDRSIRKWDLRKADSCMMVFDKNKPDLEFIGERCRQSPAFRQLFSGYEKFIGRGFYSGSSCLSQAEEPPVSCAGVPSSSLSDGQCCSLAEVAAAAASAAFPEEPLSFLDRLSSASNRKRQGWQRTSQFAELLRPKVLIGGPGLGSRRSEYASIKSSPSGVRKGLPALPGGLAATGKAVQQREVLLDDDGNSGLAMASPAAGDRHLVKTKRVSETTGGPSSKKFMTSKRQHGVGDGDRLCSRSRAVSVPGATGHPQGAFAPPHGDSDDSDGTRMGKLLNQYGTFVRRRQAAEKSCIPVIRPVGISVARNPRGAAKGIGKLGCRESCGECSQTSYEKDRLRCKTSDCIPIASEQLDNNSGAELWRPPCIVSKGSMSEMDNELGDAPRYVAPCGGSTRNLVNRPSTLSEARAHDAPVTSLVLSPDGSFLISSGGDGRIRLWNAANGRHCFVHMMLNIPRHTSAQALSREARHRRILPPPAGVEGFCAGPGTKTSSFFWGRQAAVSATGKYVMHGRGRTLCTYDVFTGVEEQLVLAGQSGDIICVAWNGERCEAYSGFSDGTVVIYDAMSGGNSDDEALSDEEDLEVVDVVPANSL